MAYQSSHTGQEIDNAVVKVSQLLDLFYPVGSIYTSTKNTNPAATLGGTWTQIKDRFLLCAGDSYAAGATGGSATHTHTSAAHTHTTAGHTLTVNEMPSHGHGVGYYASASNYVPKNSTAFRGFRYQSDIYTPYINGVLTDMGPSGYTYDNFIENTGGGASHSHGNTGSTTPGNTGSSSNLPPYKVVYAWERTA